MTSLRPDDVRDDVGWSVLYLALPVAVWSGGFLRPVLAVLTILLIGAGGLAAAWPMTRGRGGWKLTAVSCGAGCAVLAATGFPGGPFPLDWIKHWAVLEALAERPWPVVETIFGSREYLRYYLGGYVVPALAHKLFPAVGAPAFLALWLLGGLVLMFRRIGAIGATWRQGACGMLLFLALAGAEVYLAKYVPVNRAGPWLGLHYDSWATMMRMPLEFSSMLTLLVWVPTQGIPTFLVTGLLVSALRGGALAPVFLTYGLLTLFSPYGALGLLPLIVTLALRRWREMWQWRVLAGGGAGLVAGLVVALYLATDMPQGGMCLTCFRRDGGELFRIGIFLVVGLLPYLLLTFRVVARDAACIVSVVTLVALPFFHGHTADFVMRGSMGGLFVLALAGVEAVLRTRLPRWQRALQVAALALCLPVPLSEIWYVQTAGRVADVLPEQNLFRSPEQKVFAHRDRYTFEEYLDICGRDYLPQYFSTVPPHLLRLPPRQASPLP